MKNLFKRILSWFRELFGMEATPVATPDTESIVEAPKPVSGDVFKDTPFPIDISRFVGKPVFELMRAMGRGMTPQEEALARQVGVIFSDPPKQEGIDLAGFNLGVGGGTVKVNPVQANVYTAFTFKATKKIQHISIFGAPGAFFKSATIAVAGMSSTKSAKGVGTQFEMELAPGEYLLEVKVDGTGSLGVQYTQR